MTTKCYTLNHQFDLKCFQIFLDKNGIKLKCREDVVALSLHEVHNLAVVFLRDQILQNYFALNTFSVLMTAKKERNHKFGMAGLAQWICLCLPSCGTRFESQEHLRFSWFKLMLMEKNRNKQKEAYYYPN